jgi:hypothetical protein
MVLPVPLVSGQGYFITQLQVVITLTLPASPVFGDTITITDYASTFATNNVTLNPNGNKIEGATTNGILSTNDQTHTLVYTDTTQGWKIVNQDTASSIQPTYIAATGGTVTTSGDYKIHSFTGDGCFVVSAVGNPIGGNQCRLFSSCWRRWWWICLMLVEVEVLVDLDIQLTYCTVRFLFQGHL